MKNILFWNVDTQKDFMLRDGALYVQDAEKIKWKLLILTEFAKKYDIKVVNTADWHDKDSKELSDKPDFINTFPEHCMKDTNGADFIPETRPDNYYVIDWAEITLLYGLLQMRNIVILKDKFDVFEGNPFTEEVLKVLNPSEVIVYGVASNVCVDYAIKGLSKKRIQSYGSKGCY